MPGFRRRSDEDSKLRNLEKRVAPTVGWLVERGRLPDVLKALRLEDSNLPLTRLGPQGTVPEDTVDECGEETPPRKGES